MLNPLHAPLRFLTQPRVPLWRYCLTAFVAAVVPSMILAGGVQALLAAVGADVDGMGAPDRQVTVGEFLGMVVFAPIVETVVQGLLLHILKALSERTLFVATASALLWGAAHAAVGPLWFFGTVWSFFVLSCAYLAWLPRSAGSAFVAAAVPHGLINLTSFGMLAMISRP